MIKRFFCAIGLVFSLQYAHGFALLGPLPASPGGEPWQVPTIGYGLAYTMTILNMDGGEALWLGDVGGPHNIGEEYRRNAPVLYYAYDANFSGFFGPEGETAVDQAFGIINGLTNVNNYSTALSEFPLQSQSFNPTAQALYLTDIKSVTLHLLVEELGLAEPERYTWLLHDRFVGSHCPTTTTYLVAQRNFDIIASPLNQIQYSPYVNGTLYTYLIYEVCSGFTPLADTVPFPADPLQADQYTAVAANNFEPLGEGFLGGFGVGGGLQLGGFYTGLTRDDVAGLRYLLSTNNINYESPAAGSFWEQTNLTTWQYLYTTNFGALVAQSLTNDPVTLAALYPGLQIASSSNYPGLITNPIIVAYMTNYPGSPAGSPPIQVVKTNGYTYTPITYYVTKFANVVIPTNWFANSYRTNTRAQMITTTIGVPYGAPVGTPPTNMTSIKNITLTNVVSGDYYLIPPGTCGFNIPSPQPSGFPVTNPNGVTYTTNIISQGTNSAGEAYTVSLVFTVTNHLLAVNPCVFATNATGWYQGIQRVRFVRVPDGDVDPLTGNFLIPMTNYYTMVYYDPTNYQITQRTFQRIVTAPDILLTAQDLADGPAGINFNFSVIRTTPNFDTGNVLPGLRGPGVINSPSAFTYNKVGDIFYNGPFADTNSFIDQTTQLKLLQWASFDGTTNDPVLYPSGTGIQNLESQLIIQVSPTALPDGTNNLAYATTTLTVTGGQAPYTWSLASGSQPLPNGLTLSSGGTISGTPTGNPAGTYDFTVQLNDSAARTVQWGFSINIH